MDRKRESLCRGCSGLSCPDLQCGASFNSQLGDACFSAVHICWQRQDNEGKVGGKPSDSDSDGEGTADNLNTLLAKPVGAFTSSAAHRTRLAILQPRYPFCVTPFRRQLELRYPLTSPPSLVAIGKFGGRAV